MKEYYFNKWIFRGAILFIFILFIYSLATIGLTNKVYVHCPENAGFCHNPFYKNCDLLRGKDPSVLQALRYCNESRLFQGTTIGEPPTWFMKNNFLLVGIILFIAFAINHFLYNKPSQLRLRRSTK